jgi:mono/diheme cytochrome c family protein
LIPFAVAALLAWMPVKAVAADNGQQLYMLHCSGCHGITGISAVPDAKNFSRIELMAQPDQNLVSVIRSGRNMMPPYLGILSDQEILSIINYIRTLN